ncbi:hypothetical protein JQ597_28825 [Bradyrhizobium sp. AUGA SZCCT0177]|uniref:hypothetical protein n=1 Tax=Bradyrhizobium sp. AUGA SZCCT0177 TaxID=2807665 RepID=UPI001BA4CA0B|nr:hypothetical protein [Bradyrhizobium sp. AUGA SZCCT0177]MBR1286062.1 hypothetical protein [Bradyrhizobium sp. AUGA SZCCT0177]
MSALIRAIEPSLDDYGNVAGAASHQHGKTGSDLSRSSLGRARGLHDPTATYHAMDVVAHNGSEWRAIKDNPGPLPGPGWMLGAKGARGKPGERGEPGLHVKALDVTGYTLVLTLSNGSKLRANLLPAFERFKKETET